MKKLIKIAVFLIGLGPNMALSEPSIVRALVMGDSGTGEAGQYQVAAAMKEVCDKNGCDFAMMLGDNIYNNGASSSDDKQFITKFEAPYRSLDFPFYAALGNHDIRSGAEGTAAQVSYTQRSKKWKMFAPYYTYTVDNVAFFVIDSNTFTDDAEQQQWLEEGLISSEKGWKIVYGHHSPYSVGRHAKNDWLEGSKLKHLKQSFHETLCQYADGYFAGHDHHLQVGIEECGLLTLVSGAAAKTRGIYDDMINQRNKEGQIEFAKGDQLGFIHVAFGEAQIDIEVYNEDASLLYETKFSKRAKEKEPSWFNISSDPMSPFL